MNRVLFILLLIGFTSCSSQRQLQKIYLGKPLSEVQEKFGKPKAVLDHGEENVYVFERSEELRSTEIKQGKLTLDPVITPNVRKTERFYFTMKEGKVIKVKLEEEYER